MPAARHDTAIWLAVVCLSLASCALLLPPQRDIDDKALLNQIPSELPHRDRRTATVLVLPPETAALYDTREIAYTTRPHEIAYLTRRQWGETPSEMLQPLLTKTLEDTRAFAAVVVPPYTARYTCALETRILELRQDFTAGSAAVVLSLRFRLTNAEGRVIATKEVSLREPMRQLDSDAGVVAANDATAQALREMAAFVVDNTD